MVWAFVIAALLLAVERLCYIWVWHRPEQFQRVCQHPLVMPFGEPIVVLEKLFYGFKALQVAVFFGWCVVASGGLPITLPPARGSFVSVGAGVLLIVIGQMLNFGVFYRLGKHGVFYGVKFGHDIPWCTAFPFSVLKHPQYVGALLSIWGFFLAARYPHHDWVVLPLLETLYYAVGARYERQ